MQIPLQKLQGCLLRLADGNTIKTCQTFSRSKGCRSPILSETIIIIQAELNLQIYD
jgi:hypothetical protein